MPTDAAPLARWLTRRAVAWVVALVPLLLTMAVLATVGQAEREISAGDSSPVGADSTAAIELADQLPAEDGMTAIILWSAESGTLTQAHVDDLTAQVVERLGAPPQATRPAGPPPLTVAEDRTAALTVLPVQSTSNSDNIDKVEDLRSELRASLPDGVGVEVTGPAGIQADIGQVFDGANLRLLLTTAGIVALLLILTYRSPILWLVPLTVIALADRFAAVVSTHVLDALGLVWDESTIGILSVLVFGAGTNYALLLISRYRDELRTNSSRYDAMAHALSRTTEAVGASATTVIVGLLTLLLSVMPTTRGLGMACAVGIVIAAAFVLVVLPAVLVLFGRWIFWPQTPRVGDEVLVESNSVWHRIGQAVARRPVVVVGATVAGLALLATGIFSINTGLRPSDQFLERPEAIAAAERLAESFPAGTTDPIQVVTRADPDDVVERVERVDGIDSVRIADQADGIARVDAVLGSRPGSAEALAAVADVRAAVDDLDDTHVGGGDAVSIDERNAAERDQLVIMPLILVLVVGALILLLRSLVAPLVLVATVLATYAASMGAAWWLFTTVFDFAALDVGVPLLAFLFLVALGVDYNIFLVTRAREEGRVHGTRTGILRSLTATGGVITSAGILLASVFAVLGVLPLVVLAQLGAIIFVGVLIDTLVVRTLLVPALVLVLGDRFWWPAGSGASVDA